MQIDHFRYRIRVKNLQVLPLRSKEVISKQETFAVKLLRFSYFLMRIIAKLLLSFSGFIITSEKDVSKNLLVTLEQRHVHFAERIQDQQLTAIAED